MCSGDSVLLEEFPYYDKGAIKAADNGGKKLCAYLNAIFDKNAEKRDKEDSDESSDDSFVASDSDSEDGKEV